jgi:hypothetical protein
MLCTVACAAAHRVSSAVVRAGSDSSPVPRAIEAPRLLSETGLYGDAGSAAVDPLNLPYAPQYPLWTDGAAKRRWVYLPPGQAIDTSDVDAWDFPVGTRFWKEFSFGGRKIETRLLWRASADRWILASYVWNAEQTDAERAPDEGLRGVVEVAPNRRHGIPSVAECRMCHGTARTEVLGFSALQLSTDRDPEALHAEPLEPDMLSLPTLIESERLSPTRREWMVRQPRIRSGNPRTRAALGYLSANCGHCHNASSSLESLGLVLRHSAAADAPCVEPGLHTTLGRTGAWSLPGHQPGTSPLIQPGQPELSTLLYRVQSRRPSSQMPPLGTVVEDRAATALLTAWIRDDLNADVTAAPPCGGRLR